MAPLGTRTSLEDMLEGRRKGDTRMGTTYGAGNSKEKRGIYHALIIKNMRKIWGFKHQNWAGKTTQHSDKNGDFHQQIMRIGLLWKTRWKTMGFTPSSGGSCRFYLKPILGRVLTGSSWGEHVELEKPWKKTMGGVDHRVQPGRACSCVDLYLVMFGHLRRLDCSSIQDCSQHTWYKGDITYMCLLNIWEAALKIPSLVRKGRGILKPIGPGSVNRRKNSTGEPLQIFYWTVES